MPRRTRPQPKLPSALEAVAAALSAREDLALLAALGRVPDASAPELIEDLGMAANTAHRHLTNLEAHGLVRANFPAGDRRGRNVRYSLDRPAAAAALDALKAAVLDGRPRRTP